MPGSTDNRLASALPAEPPPTMMKSYLGGAMARDASSVRAGTSNGGGSAEDPPPFRCLAPDRLPHGPAPPGS